MADISCRQVNLDRPDALRTFSDLNDYLDRRVVFPQPYLSGREVTVSSAAFVLIDSSMVSGNIAVGSGTTEHDGVFAAEIMGALGTAEVQYATDDVGNILNLIEIRDSTLQGAIMAGDSQVFGLVQCASGTADGEAIGAAASENLQISFITIDAYDTPSLAVIDETIEFTVNKVKIEGRRPAIQMIGNAAEDLLVIGANESQGIVQNRQVLRCTADFAANEVFNKGSGIGVTSGTFNVSGNSVDILTSAAEFNMAPLLDVWRNGVKQRRGVDVIWDSNATMHFVDPLTVGEYVEITKFAEDTSGAALNVSNLPSGAALDATIGSPWSWTFDDTIFDFGGDSYIINCNVIPSSVKASSGGWLNVPAAFYFGDDSDLPLTLSGTPDGSVSQLTILLTTYTLAYATGPTATFTVEVS